MVLFSCVFVFLDSETEVVVQILSVEILLILPSGKGFRFFIDTQSSNYETGRIRHCVDSFIHASTLVIRA
jgi:hypothetical protein